MHGRVFFFVRPAQRQAIHIHFTNNITDFGAPLSETPSELGPFNSSKRTYQSRA